MSATHKSYAKLQSEMLSSVQGTHSESGEGTLDRYAARLQEIIDGPSGRAPRPPPPPPGPKYGGHEIDPERR